MRPSTRTIRLHIHHERTNSSLSCNSSTPVLTTPTSIPSSARFGIVEVVGVVAAGAVALGPEFFDEEVGVPALEGAGAGGDAGYGGGGGVEGGFFGEADARVEVFAVVCEDCGGGVVRFAGRGLVRKSNVGFFEMRYVLGGKPKLGVREELEKCKKKSRKTYRLKTMWPASSSTNLMRRVLAKV